MSSEARVYRFGPFVLDTVSFKLSRAGAAVPLSPKIIDLLHYLVARPSTLVTKEELFKALWPGVAVTDNALTQAVSELRQALSDDPGSPVYIQTVARRGYRFVAPIEKGEFAPGTGEPVAPAPTGVPRSIAVTDFSNVSGDAAYAWLSTGIAETVTNDLRELGTLRVIDRVQVAEALRRTGGSIGVLRAERLADLAVVGSFQRAGDRLRMTARVIDVSTGEALADAKSDGALADVFDLQDRIVAQFAAELGLAIGTVSERRVGIRETSSLEAYERFTEGRVALESLDAARLPEAIASLERALELDPRYALVEVGLANARFFQYEASRARNRPDAGTLAGAIDHARRAIELDRGLAEAHATLAFLLASAGRSREALAAARRAVAIEPAYWGNQFRLGHAAWGEERLRALQRSLELYPEFPFVHLEMAMVHIARGALERAETLLREGAVVQDRQIGRRQRYPARGLHWLLGLVRLARGDAREAATEFERELETSGTQLYAAEFTMNAFDGLGFVRLGEGRHAAAIAAFRRALEHYPEHARSRLGAAAALRAEGRMAEADAELNAARGAIAELRRGGRAAEALMAEAFEHAVLDRRDQAVATIERLLTETDQPSAAWIVPLEPLFRRLHGSAGFDRVLSTLAARAR